MNSGALRLMVIGVAAIDANLLVPIVAWGLPAPVDNRPDAPHVQANSVTNSPKAAGIPADPRFLWRWAVGRWE